jgi:hypothetical protein
MLMPGLAASLVAFDGIAEPSGHSHFEPAETPIEIITYELASHPGDGPPALQLG